MEAARHLHVIEVDSETGEVVEPTCEGCQRRDDEIAGLQRDIRGWAYRYRELERDKEADAKAHKHWPTALELHTYWRECCNHPRCEFDADAFYLIEPFIRRSGIEMCKRAIDGAAYDHWVTTRRNGSKKRHDGFDLIFKNRTRFEEFVNRAPREAA
jgi:hypothetical protein